MTKPFGPIDLGVGSMERASPFYRAIMPELGFTKVHGPGRPHPSFI